DVHLAASAAEGTAQLSEPPDVIFLADIMPGESGIDFIEHLRHNAPSLIRRIVLLASSEKIESVFTGRLPILMKPFDLEQLVNIVHELPTALGELPDSNELRSLRSHARQLAQQRYAPASQLLTGT